MKSRFVVLDRGHEPRIYKFQPDQKARLAATLWREKVEYFDDLSAAKDAAMVIIERYGQATMKTREGYSFRTAAKLKAMAKQIAELTESQIETFSS